MSYEEIEALVLILRKLDDEEAANLLALIIGAIERGKK